MTSSDYWDDATAARYDDSSAFMFTPEVLTPTVDRLEALADGGRVLELAIGTGRVALPLAERGLEVHGIELSRPMVEQLHRKDPSIPVVVGDMATARAPGQFSLVYLVFNTLGNLRTQAEQVACFRNAAGHLRPGGAFVVEITVPALRRFPPGQSAIPFHVGRRHVGFDTYDLTTQQATSHQYSHEADGTIRYGEHHFRYVWPAELDLMAQLAGLEFTSRHADWAQAPFTSESESHVSLWRRPPEQPAA